MPEASIRGPNVERQVLGVEVMKSDENIEVPHTVITGASLDHDRDNYQGYIHGQPWIYPWETANTEIDNVETSSFSKKTACSQ